MPLRFTWKAVAHHLLVPISQTRNLPPLGPLDSSYLIAWTRMALDETTELFGGLDEATLDAFENADFGDEFEDNSDDDPDYSGSDEISETGYLEEKYAP